LTTSNSALPGVAYGDNFVDASDGVVEGHYAAWTLDGVPSTGTPAEVKPVGLCGAHSLSLESHYIPYTGSGASIVPALPSNSHFVSSVSNITYDVKPFVADVQIASSNATSVTFRNATRSGAAFTNGASTPWTVSWQLLNSAGTEILNQSGPSTAGVQDTFVVNKSQITNNSKIVLTITVDAAQINAASGCSTMVTSTKTYPLLVPDPQLSVTGCANIGSPCTITASSTNVQDMTGWSYAWSVDSGTPVTSSSKTFTPNVTVAGSHTIALTASNAIGAGQASTSITPAPSICNGAPKNVTFTYSGVTSQCLNGNCTNPAEPISFKAQAFLYTFQTCDTFTWSFGDSTSSTEQNPTHQFTGSGPFTVSLTVSNSSGSAPAFTATLFGSVDPGPGPGPGPTCNAIPTTVNPVVTFSGPNSGCLASNTTPCAAGENVRFSASFGTYIPNAQCDTISWNFGDNRTGSGSSPTHNYTAAGTYNVSVNISGGGRTRTGNKTVTVTGNSGGGNCVAPSRGSVGLSFTGAQCSLNNGTCEPGESIKFTANVFLYNIQSCDTFEWNFNDGSPTQSTTTGTINHTFPTTQNNFNVSVTLKNSAGALAPATAAIAFGQGASEAPHDVTIASVSSAAPNTDVSFVGSALPAGEIASWEWDFNDGSKATGQSATHKFTREGTFNVSLKATNNKGSAVGNRTVVISSGKRFAYVLPVVAHLGGQAGSQWRTDLQIFNPDPSKPLEVTFTFKGQDRTLNVDSSTYIYEDFMKFFTGNDDVGPVIVRGVAGTAVPQMWTRTYNEAASGVGTYGQLIPAVPIETSASSTTGAPRYFLPGMENSSRARSNLGLVNPTANPVDLTVSAFDNDAIGTPLGGFVVTVNPFSLNQIGDLPNRITGLPSNRPYSLRLTNSSGAPIVAYSSTVDNVSNDPAYVSAVPDTSLTATSMKKQIIPGVGHLSNGNWKSDVTIFNADGATVQLDLTYYDQSGAKVSEAKNVTLGANTFFRLEDLLRAGLLIPQGETDSYGTLLLETTTSEVTRYPVVYARTYSDRGASGTFGQGIGAFASANANVKSGTPAYIAGARNDQKYRTNIGLVSVSDQPTRVRITLLDRLTGVMIGQPIELPNDKAALAQYESRIQPDVFTAAGASSDRAAVKIEVISGGPVWAYASIIDKTTSDPQYVPASPLN
jgi:PKD repeat protein